MKFRRGGVLGLVFFGAAIASGSARDANVGNVSIDTASTPAVDRQVWTGTVNDVATDHSFDTQNLDSVQILESPSAGDAPLPNPLHLEFASLNPSIDSTEAHMISTADASCSTPQNSHVSDSIENLPTVSSSLAQEVIASLTLPVQFLVRFHFFCL